MTEQLDLEIFRRLNGWTLADFHPRLRHLEAGGQCIAYLAPEDLILLKEGSWREKDKFDVQAMREIIQREGR